MVPIRKTSIKAVVEFVRLVDALDRGRQAVACDARRELRRLGFDVRRTRRKGTADDPKARTDR